MRAYRALVRLYPRELRREFGDDLVALHDDLTGDRGRTRAWRICALDLLVTLPRMHLERIMAPHRTSTAITWAIVLLAVAGAAAFVTGLHPGALLFVAAVVLGVTQRSALTRAIRTPDTTLRHRRLRTAAVLAIVFVACYGVYLVSIGDEWTIRETVLAVVGTLSMFGAAGYLVVGLATPTDTALRS